jgi:GNAT superfamily N-acetyltransferase
VADEIEVRRLEGDELTAWLDGLASVLLDCVDGGASVGYVLPFSHDDARAAFAGFASEVAAGRRILLGAFEDGVLAGTAQIVFAGMPNQRHRAEIAKLLVRRSSRRRGVAARLMAAAEVEAAGAGRTLLVLDTVTGDAAERLYERLGWNRVGVVPGYALYPDGRACSTTFFWKRVAP